jgi:hypothetical protein
MAELVGLDTGGALGKSWKLTIELADCAGCGIEPGVYRYESSDDGWTWKAAASE